MNTFDEAILSFEYSIKETSRKEEAFRIAKQLKNRGIPFDEIVKICELDSFYIHRLKCC